MKSVEKGLVKKAERNNHLEDLDVDERIVLKLMLWNWVGGCQSYSCSSRGVPVRSFYECDDPSCSIKGEELLE